jgi:hypothetical protein
VSKRTSLIFFVLVGYIVLQFLWWEILLVKQSDAIISLKQNIAALSSTDDEIILRDVETLQHKKTNQLYMIVGEGTVFLLILLFGVYQVRKSIKKETELADQKSNFILSISIQLFNFIGGSNRKSKMIFNTFLFILFIVNSSGFCDKYSQYSLSLFILLITLKCKGEFGFSIIRIRFGL